MLIVLKHTQFPENQSHHCAVENVYDGKVCVLYVTYRVQYTIYKVYTLVYKVSRKSQNVSKCI